MQNNYDTLNTWLSFSQIYNGINDKLEQALQERFNMSLKEFYVLYFISQSGEKKLRLQQLQDLVGLSQSAISRLVARLEAKNCGALERAVCEADRRGIYTSITEYGEDKLERALQTYNEELQQELQTGKLNILDDIMKKLQ
ncbi:MarR family winged helix-turn-helix transcriptional regulator [Paenibacillus sp. NFR01]|uniref:MarR family winged helix-turn-helix transcriptional regulator n=1 Tax=Paenibacillus sp. NFR01 TaxID=1566279 RepID=UPI0008D4D0D5|nr:MarR family transcriptional regulator [Paenibacillus sp. NFR01]SET22793.1 DNA-binding transcriptional regulator, MarR family [Paenibacillus sp. NFR01]